VGARLKWGAVFLAACVGDIESPDDYATKRAEAMCQRIERCQQGEFERDYSNRDECVEDNAAVIQDEIEFLDLLDCTYLPDHAGLCVSRIRQLSCEEWFEEEAFKACDLVFDCPLGGTVSDR
jgi:hypothetical protein